MSSVSKPRVRHNRHKQGLNLTLEKLSADFREYLKLESKVKRKFVLYKVKYCRYYRNKLKNKNRYNHNLGKQQRKLFSCLRLHIVPNDGDADGKLIMIA